jgi:hypothetical protein
MLIPDERLERALAKLAKTDQLAAELHMRMEQTEFKAKATREAVFLRCEGNVAERSAQAQTSDDYSKAMDCYFEALKAYEGLKNERAREVLIISCWQTLNANMRKGLL